MPTYARAIADGKYLRYTRWATTADDATPPETQIDDFAIAFGIPAEKITWEIKAWDGDPAHLPTEDEPDAIERIPEEQRPGYVKPEPQPPTLEEKVAAMLAAMPATQQADVSAALKG